MIKGSLPALVTPFKNGELDLVTLKKLVEWHIAEGSSGLVPVGTTGESPTLTHAEHQKVIEVVVETVAGRVPVIAGAGSNNTAEGISLMRHAEKVGATAALVVTPYYNKPTQAGLIAHFTALHDCCALPIIIYNIPGRSVVDMSPETMGELAKLPRIIGASRAKELSLTGNYLDAETAERWGLVNRVYAPEELLPAAKKLAAEMAGVEGGLLKRMKAVIDDGLALPLPEALKMEIERGSANNSAVTPEAAEASRKTAMERGREQSQ